MAVGMALRYKRSGFMPRKPVTGDGRGVRQVSNEIAGRRAQRAPSQAPGVMTGGIQASQATRRALGY